MATRRQIMVKLSTPARRTSMGRRRGRVRPVIDIGVGRRVMLAAICGTATLPWAHAAANPSSGSRPAPLQDVESIVVMPIVFSRGTRVDDRAELQRNIDQMLLRKLALKGYVLDRPRNWSAPQDWSVEALTPLGPAALAALLPANARHVALLLVQRLDEASVTVASSASVAIAARIVDAATGQVLWHATSEGEHDEHLLSGGLMVGPITQLLVMAFTPDHYLALERAFGRLFERFPERP